MNEREALVRKLKADVGELSEFAGCGGTSDEICAAIDKLAAAANDQQLRDALKRIQFAGNDGNAVAIWMQKVAAHALCPEQWGDPGPQAQAS